MAKNTQNGQNRAKRFQARYGMKKSEFLKLKKTDPQKAHELKMLKNSK